MKMISFDTNVVTNFAKIAVLVPLVRWVHEQFLAPLEGCRFGALTGFNCPLGVGHSGTGRDDG